MLELALEHGGMTKSRAQILGIEIDNIRRGEALAAVRTFLVNPQMPRKIFFANVHTFQLGRHNEAFREIVNGADLVLPDGAGLHIAGRLLHEPILENLNGTDFTPLVLSEAEEDGLNVYLLGAQSRILQSCIERLSASFPGLAIAGSHDGFNLQRDDRFIVNEIQRTRPHLVLVALGSPLQEEWIAKHADLLPPSVYMAVGGLFDFLSGEFQRAPVWMRDRRIEWIYRFLRDPIHKWRRVLLEIPAFATRVGLSSMRTRLIASVPETRRRCG